MGILEEFEKKPWRYFQRKRENTKETERRRKQRLLDFLYFCECYRKKGKIADIDQDDWSAFCYWRRKRGAGDATMYQYALAIRDFVRMAHLSIQINPGRVREKMLSRRGKKEVKAGK